MHWLSRFMGSTHQSAFFSPQYWLIRPLISFLSSSRFGLQAIDNTSPLLHLLSLLRLGNLVLSSLLLLPAYPDASTLPVNDVLWSSSIMSAFRCVGLYNSLGFIFLSVNAPSGARPWVSVFRLCIEAGGKPSTWWPPGKLVEHNPQPHAIVIIPAWPQPGKIAKRKKPWRG